MLQSHETGSIAELDSGTEIWLAEVVNVLFMLTNANTETPSGTYTHAIAIILVRSYKIVTLLVQ